MTTVIPKLKSKPGLAGRLKGFKFLAVLLLLVSVAFATACAPDYRGLKPPIRKNVFERAPVGHKIDVERFEWKYIRGGGGLQVNGTVINKSGQDQRPVVLYCILFDETGLAVGMGEARVSPTLLPAGGKGTFNLIVGTSHPSTPKPIKYLRLLTNAQND